MKKLPKLNKHYAAYIMAEVDKALCLERMRGELAKMTRVEFRKYFDEHLRSVTEGHFRSLPRAYEMHSSRTVNWKQNTNGKLYELQRWCKDGTKRIRCECLRGESHAQLEKEGVYLFPLPPDNYDAKIACIITQAKLAGFGKEAIEQLQEGIKRGTASKARSRAIPQGDWRAKAE